MRFSIDFTEACPLLSSFARRETRKLESSSAWLSIVRVKTAPAISSADHPTDSSLKRVDVAVSSPPLLMERDGHRGDAFRCGALRDSARQLIELKGGTRRGCCSIDCLDLLAQVKMKTWIGERARGRKDERIIGEGVVLLLLLFVPNHFRNVPRRSTHLMIEI